MSNTEHLLNSGYNNMYNPIFCNIFPLNNGFKTCNNCNYGDSLSKLNQTTQNSEQKCLKQCKNEKTCTAYSYNNLNGTNNCTLYNDFPSNIVQNVANINSGYDLTKFSYDYNNLGVQQQNNIQNKCASQYMNNIFTPQNTNIDLSNCLNINNGTNTSLNYDPKCVFDIYKQNNILNDNNYVNNYNYIDDTNLIDSEHDLNIDEREKNYNGYINGKNANLDINQKLRDTDSTYIEYNNKVGENNNLLYSTFPSTVNLDNNLLTKLSGNVKHMIGGKVDIKEGFENRTYFERILIIFIIILFIILIIFYIFKKK